MEIFLILVGVLVTLVYMAVLLVLPIIALVRTSRLTHFQRRLDNLEDEVLFLRRMIHKGVVKEPAPSFAEEIEPAEAVLEVKTLEPIEARPGKRIRVFSIEEWIGRRGLGWAAVVLLLFATAFFLKYAFDNAWIGEVGRVTLGVLAGITLCVIGARAHRRGARLGSQMLTAGGIVLLYLATFAAFGYYHLVGREFAALILIVLVAQSAAMALIQNAPAIALMALIGGLVNPLLLHSDHDSYRSLFLYLTILDMGVVGLVLVRSWRVLGSVALLGTHLLFWSWWWENDHPEKRSAALLFQGAVFVLFLAYHLVAHVLRPRQADVEALVRLVVNAYLFATATYTLMAEDHAQWLGSVAVGLATVHCGITWYLLRRRSEDARQLVVLGALGLSFVATVLPLQHAVGWHRLWVPVAWAVEGAALAVFGLRIRTNSLRILGGVLLLVSVFRLMIDTPTAAGRSVFLPLVNGYGLSALLVAAAVLSVAAISWRREDKQIAVERIVRHVAGLTGVLVLWLILSIETYQWLLSKTFRDLGLVEDYRRLAHTSLSVLWSVYAGLLLVLGFRLELALLRWTALGLFGLTLAKVFCVDMADLPGFYRVAAFFILSVLMGAGAWGYQKVGQPQPRLPEGGVS